MLIAMKYSRKACELHNDVKAYVTAEVFYQVY